MNKLDKYIFLSIVVLLLYCMIVLFMAWFDHSPPPELTVGMFGFFGTEIAACAFIKRWKLKERDSDE